MMELPTYIPLDEAVRRYRIDREALTRMVESGKIRAVKIDGRVAVPEEDVIVAATRVQPDDENEWVSIREAGRRLSLHPGIISRWHKYGWLTSRGRGPNRIILINLRQAERLALLREQYGKKGRRLIQDQLILR